MSLRLIKSELRKDLVTFLSDVDIEYVSLVRCAATRVPSRVVRDETGKIVVKWDPDQPRDSGGRFAPKGGGTSSPSSSSSSASKAKPGVGAAHVASTASKAKRIVTRTKQGVGAKIAKELSKSPAISAILDVASIAAGDAVGVATDRVVRNYIEKVTGKQVTDSDIGRMLGNASGAIVGAVAGGAAGAAGGMAIGGPPGAAIGSQVGRFAGSAFGSQVGGTIGGLGAGLLNKLLGNETASETEREDIKKALRGAIDSHMQTQGFVNSGQRSDGSTVYENKDKTKAVSIHMDKTGMVTIDDVKMKGDAMSFEVIQSIIAPVGKDIEALRELYGDEWYSRVVLNNKTESETEVRYIQKSDEDFDPDTAMAFRDAGHGLQFVVGKLAATVKADDSYLRVPTQIKADGDGFEDPMSVGNLDPDPMGTPIVEDPHAHPSNSRYPDALDRFGPGPEADDGKLSFGELFYQKNAALCSGVLAAMELSEDPGTRRKTVKQLMTSFHNFVMAALDRVDAGGLKGDMKAEWDESKHPRGEGGRFGSGGGGGGSGSSSSGGSSNSGSKPSSSKKPSDTPWGQIDPANKPAWAKDFKEENMKQNLDGYTKAREKEGFKYTGQDEKTGAFTFEHEKTGKKVKATWDRTGALRSSDSVPDHDYTKKTKGDDEMALFETKEEMATWMAETMTPVIQATVKAEIEAAKPPETEADKAAKLKEQIEKLQAELAALTTKHDALEHQTTRSQAARDDDGQTQDPTIKGDTSAWSTIKRAPRSNLVLA